MEAILHSRPRDLQSLPAGPRAPAIVQVAGYLGDPIAYVERCRERYGPVFTLRWPGMPPMVYFTEPEPIRAIFRASPEVLQAGRSNSVLDFIAGPRSVARLDGDAHKQRRRGMVSPFSRLGPSYLEAMAGNTLALFDELADAPAPIAFREASQSLSLRNLIRCALGIHDPARAARLHDLMLTFMRESLNPVMAALWMSFPGVSLRELVVRRLPFLTLARTIRELDELLFQVIAEARVDSSERTDVLSLLVRMHEGIDDQGLRDELMAILVAGHETTSTTMDWFMVEALSRPAVLERVRDEVDRVLGRGSSGLGVTLASLAKLEFLDAVIHECLRLYPPVPAVGRHVAQEVTIAGVTLPVGVIASPSIALLHRDPSVWADPLAFRPERWLTGDVDKRSFIAFGGGARTCLGKPFGLFQLQVVLATLVSRFDLRPSPWPRAKQVQRGLFTGVGHPVEVRVSRRA